MSSHLDDLFNKNREWAAKVTAEDPEFFSTLSKQQQPEYLWIGCADSRVPANQIVDLLPGEVFVHRNIANVVVHTDLNCLSVIQFAVDVLKVKHIMVVGHYGCGGIKAAMGTEEHGMIDNWLRHIKDVYRLHRGELDAIEDEHTRFDRMCELNVVEQVANVCQSSIVQNAWKIGQELHVHGWCYSIEDGHITDLKRTVSSAQESLEQMNNM
ncbi:MAG: carbonate dehydratase [Gammaproteobacteria bacterium]|jgi:carbonic anhydrase|uniref:Carbonic anhydrase n=1 Tax=Marinomonas polaris DSM 16579 TaxID=1122206 RepID=A0A1M5K4I5_9GAMM|nr:MULTISPECIES: carbonate dehydratase [Marinomonas]MBU1294014.1 carbonate dehydratase [Gammaproteobacteria bacterium]MBU1467072.1 carbonate dehydratase [Gammaproteobacteria bacterium]MBU2023833.1 carbonate dehydratase [Gammaproteobacteria bacterium]MBU2236702.1 carbonate dehydratase [Gammaproteobacteria bacterium]MBU2317108.1 carbonate dehydratase [Gammaproteobacteria bacterium]|tara:strand:+ start:4319 stop:4951 length:633 start_codon:yes stop_codon:yes gene_type:complete